MKDDALPRLPKRPVCSNNGAQRTDNPLWYLGTNVPISRLASVTELLQTSIVRCCMEG
jgi:hypothetical protein